MMTTTCGGWRQIKRARVMWKGCRRVRIDHRRRLLLHVEGWSNGEHGAL